ncbi:17-beta-hydroxysteroid dehydrogenase 14-like [Maniola hyperantus]|uniref:17-beta-hydroxysteroid dehydrogenase 14-like n=1 Tax=Aphantopus hyperantus TaxID=2795564 RepID=UPI002135F946
MSFKNKVVIVTGASSGIGAVIAEEFSAEGAKVVIVGRSEAKLNHVARSCTNYLIVRADLSRDEDVQKIIDETIDKFGRIDILVNNAGTYADASLLSGNLMESYDFIIRVNLRALIYLTSLAAPYIVKTKGNIINISSIVGSIAPISSGSLCYNVSKAAVNHFTTCIATELGEFGVRVNTVSPGPVYTEFIENTGFPGPWDIYKPATVLNRISRSKEIAYMVLFLASDKAKSITGVNYLVDNGMAIKRLTL